MSVPVTPHDSPEAKPLPLTDRLALDRTLLANERTLLAYIRTAIMLGVSGFTLIKLFPNELAATGPGGVLMVLALVVAVLGGYRFIQVGRDLQTLRRRGDTSSERRGI